MKALSYLFACFLLVSCSTLGAKYQTAMQNAPQLTGDQARIYFFRTNESGLYGMREAVLQVDGNGVGACPLGSFLYVDVTPGKHLLKTDMWDMPGSCELMLTAAGGAEYFIEVSARMESYKKFITTGFIGTSIEASEKTCSGAFAIFPVENKDALGRIADLAQVK